LRIVSPSSPSVSIIAIAASMIASGSSSRGRPGLRGARSSSIPTPSSAREASRKWDARWFGCSLRRLSQRRRQIDVPAVTCRWASGKRSGNIRTTRAKKLMAFGWATNGGAYARHNGADARHDGANSRRDGAQARLARRARSIREDALDASDGSLS
jgi:hypothetical protein